MFELTLAKDLLLTPLLTVAGAIDKKQHLPILANILVKLKDNKLWLTATDLEIQISFCVDCNESSNGGVVTVPAKKIVDIIRSLDDNTYPKIKYNNGVVTISEGRSTFKLTTLPGDNYPVSDDESSEFEFTLSRKNLINLLQSTHFAMSQQDVRIYLNGLLLEIDTQSITAVATDGHRMAICKFPCSGLNALQRLLIPRKGVLELLRLLNNISDEVITLSAGKSHLKLTTTHYVFSSKLIEARFPPYAKVIPRNQDKQVIIDREQLRRSLSRITILAHEKFRAVLLQIQENLLTLIANNQEQEEAVESLVAETSGDELKIGINANYLLDVLNHLPEGPLRLSLSNTETSIMVESLADDFYQYIIMPMKI
ncbi:MAG: DNA polymerase III subunit beta [Legionella sp.]